MYIRLFVILILILILILSFFHPNTELFTEETLAKEENLLSDEGFKENLNSLKKILQDNVFVHKLKKIIHIRKQLKQLRNLKENDKFKQKLTQINDNPDVKKNLCNTCQWKLKNSCTLYDTNNNNNKNNNRIWNPKCKGNNKHNGLICTFKDANLEYNCKDLCGKNTGNCTKKNKHKIYKNIGVPKCIYKNKK